MRLVNLGGGVFINAHQVVSIEYKLGAEACANQPEEARRSAEQKESRLEVFLADGRSIRVQGEQADRLYTTLMGVSA